MEGYRLLDHTADLGFECDARGENELFGRAAVALCDIIARVEPLTLEETREVRAKGDDVIGKLRAFLDEVLFQFEKDGFLTKEAVVVVGDEVVGTLRGQKVDLATHPIERVVKAVTYHGMSVKKLKGKLRARVILDL